MEKSEERKYMNGKREKIGKDVDGRERGRGREKRRAKRKAS